MHDRIEALKAAIRVLAMANDAELVRASRDTGDSLDALSLARLICQRAGQSNRVARYASGLRTANPE